MNKKAQFFILSAVIIASIVVGLATVRNSVDVGAAPAKFYYYSQQLNEETGAVVDYALYSGDKVRIEEFLQSALSDTLAKNPGMDAFSCWTKPNDPKWLVCQNNGTRSVSINVTSGIPTSLSGTDEKVYDDFGGLVESFNSVNIGGKKFLTVTLNGSQPYNIPLTNSSIQSGQFYFIIRMNTSSGSEYISSSNK